MALLDRFRRTTPDPLGEPIAAAAVRVLQPSKLPAGMAQARDTSEAWQIYRKIGEVGYAVNQQARLIGRLDWTITLDGSTEPLETDQAEQILKATFGDNVEALAERAGLCLQVPGGYVLARTVPGDRDSWRVFSSPLSAKNKKRVEMSDVVVQVRIEDPEDDDLNDSPVLRALDTGRDLILTRNQSRASARNRTAQHNLLVYPSEGVKNAQEFEDGLQDVITAPLTDERSTASVTPNILGFPADHIEKIKMIDLGGAKFDEKLDEKDARLVRSMAVQLDIPPELLMGFADSNHWAAWATQEDNWTGHVGPMAKPVGGGFAAAIMEIVEGSRLKVEPDPGPLMVRRPTTADALTANQQGLVSDEWTREQLGADETDAPVIEQQDPAVVKVLEMVIAAPSLAQDPGMDVLLDQVRAMYSGGAIPAAPAPAPAVAPASSEPPAALAAAATRTAPDPRALQAIDVQAYDAVEDLVNDTADRALERLGAKVRTMNRSQHLPIDLSASNPDLAVQFAGVIPNADSTIADTIAAATPRLDRVVTRAFSRLRSAGVDAQLDPQDAETARSLFAVLVADVVNARLQAKPTTADAWQAARRVVAVAGGNGDIAAAVAS